MIKLPEPKLKGNVSVEEAIYKRRSRRAISDSSLTINEVGQLLFSAYGITDKSRGLRSSPSAGALYPMEIYVVIGNVNGIESGLYQYIPKEHSIKFIKAGDIRKDLTKSALGQSMIEDAPISIIIASDNERTTSKYGKRGLRYIHMDAGHIGENIYLQCEAMCLATCAVGAFTDKKVKSVLGIKEEPIYIFPIGKERK